MLCAMKTRYLPAAAPLLLALALCLTASLPAQYAPAPKPAAPPATPNPKEGAKPADPAPKIEGVAIARQDGRWLGLAVEGGHFMLRLYDKDKKPDKRADVARATARWSPVNKSGDERAVLNPGGPGGALTAPQFVRPPLTFRVYLTLLDAEGKVIESVSADLKDTAAK
jgi:hypothetical protein